jgi:hypothetical protein
MAKKRKIPLGEQSIAVLIEQGKPIAGLSAYLRVEFSGNNIYIPVTVVGMSIKKGSCGIEIRVLINGTDQELAVDVCNLYRFKSEIEAAKEYEQRVEAAHADFRALAGWSTATRRREALLAYIDKMALSVRAAELFGGNTKPHDAECRMVAHDLICEHYRVTDDDVYFGSWGR